MTTAVVEPIVFEKTLCEKIAQWLVIAAVGCLMLYVPLVNKCLLVAVCFMLVSNVWKRHWKVIFTNKVIVAGIVLILLFSIGTFYSQASMKYAFRAWDKYLKVGYCAAFLPLFFQPQMRGYVFKAFLVSIMISEIFTYLHYFQFLDFNMPYKHWIFVQDLDASFLVAFACYMLANYLIESKKNRWPYIIMLLVCSIDLLFLNRERTGYVIFMGLAGLFLWQRLGWKGFVSAMIVIPILMGSLYASSPKFRYGIHEAISNISDYRKGHESTSIGLRLAFAKYSLIVIKAHPIFGIGTGSFQETYKKMQGPKLDDDTWPAHPHNEYLLILFQLGIVGLSAFLVWLFLQVRFSLQLPKQEKFLLQGLIVGFAILGCCNASLLVSPAGVAYILFLTALLGVKYDPARREIH